jgi:hypothetical protein
MFNISRFLLNLYTHKDAVELSNNRIPRLRIFKKSVYSIEFSG